MNGTSRVSEANSYIFCLFLLISLFLIFIKCVRVVCDRELCICDLILFA